MSLPRSILILGILVLLAGVGGYIYFAEQQKAEEVIQKITQPDSVGTNAVQALGFVAIATDPLTWVIIIGIIIILFAVWWMRTGDMIDLLKKIEENTRKKD